VLDKGTYPTGLRITDRQMRTLLDRHVTTHEFHGDWNYDIHPTPTTTTKPSPPQSSRHAGTNGNN
jgi:hypothetical protein